MYIAMVPRDHAERGVSCCTDIRGTCLYWGSVGTGRFRARNDPLMAVYRLDYMPRRGCGRSRSVPKRDQ